jgi:hypothetical protein
MHAAKNDLIALEKRFWQSMVDEDTDTALSLLAEPALMVSSHGAMQFDHAGYRRMAEQGSMVIKSFKLSDVNVVFPQDDMAVLTYRVSQAVALRDKPTETRQEMADSSVWTRKEGQWQCVMHTETPLGNASQH